MNNEGVYISELLGNFLYGLRGEPCEYEGVQYVVLEVKSNDMVYLGNKITDDQPATRAHMCEVKILGAKNGL